MLPHREEIYAINAAVKAIAVKIDAGLGTDQDYKQMDQYETRLLIIALERIEAQPFPV